MYSFGGLNPKKTQKQQKKPKAPFVQLTVSTWSKDSHSLYDYESVQNRYQIQNYTLKNPVKIYKHVTTMRTITQQVNQKKQLPVQMIYISSLVCKNQPEAYFIQSADVSGIEPPEILRKQHPDLFKNSYLVLRDFWHQPNVEGYPLKIGTYLRLGRLQYLVIEIKDNNGLKTLKQTSLLEVNNHIYQAKQQLQGCCKVCLCEQSTPQDPLIHPCKCKGSCQFIHVGCLKNWINSKVKKQIVGVATTYNFSKLQCEICKQILPKDIKLKNQQIIQMVIFDKPQKPYIMLQSFCDKDMKQQKKQRNLYLICPDQKTPIKIGRGHQCEIRLTDISVSRTHAQINYQNGDFYVKDLKSKFGTLVKFRQQFELRDNLKLQYGRTCYEFKLFKQTPKQQQEEQEEEQRPVFYTRAQLREMGQLSDDQEQEY